MALTTDTEIRQALHIKKLALHRRTPGTIVIDELGLSHSKVRIDVAVINGVVHGYEIKSAADTLDRLPNQIELYSRCLQRLTIVCAPRHLEKVNTLVPEWCGIVEASKGPRGAIGFSTIRRSRSNSEIEAAQLAHLLWREEVIELLVRLGVAQKSCRAPRKELYSLLANLLTVPEITHEIRTFMAARSKWRGPLARA
ncbi:sce7726 family protein [Bradyrhizobium sp. USDA 3397]